MKKMMKRNAALCLALLLLLISTLVACGSKEPAPEAENPAEEAQTAGEQTKEPAPDTETESGEPLHLKIGTTAPLGANQYTNSVRFSEILEEVSGGQMTAEVIGAGALGSSAQH